MNKYVYIACAFLCLPCSSSAMWRLSAALKRPYSHTALVERAKTLDVLTGLWQKDLETLQPIIKKLNEPQYDLAYDSRSCDLRELMEGLAIKTGRTLAILDQLDRDMK